MNSKELMEWIDSNKIGFVNGGMVTASDLEKLFEGMALVPESHSECPYPCGWDNLQSIITKEAAYFARRTLDDDVPEEVRNTGIELSRYAQDLVKAMIQAHQGENQ